MRVHADRLARARRAGDEQVRHLRQVGDHRLALEILAERDRQRRARALEVARLDQLAERDHLRRRVRHLDADRALPGNRRDDADARRAHREREVVRRGSRTGAPSRPAPGSTSNCVTTGPVVRPTSSPSTLNVRSASMSFDAHRVELALAERRRCAAAASEQVRSAAARRSSARASSRRRLDAPPRSRASRARRLLLLAAALRRLLDRRVLLRVRVGRRRTPAASAIASSASISSGGGSSASATSTGSFFRRRFGRRIRLLAPRRSRGAGTTRIGARRPTIIAHRIPASVDRRERARGEQRARPTRRTPPNQARQ